MRGEPLLSTSAQALKPWREFFAGMVARGGPRESEYADFDGWLETLAAALQEGEITALDLQLLLFEGGRATSSLQTMQGFVRVKPNGYAGDFELIDRIHQEWESPEPELCRWDRYFHTRAAFRAIRNTKEYFFHWLRGAEADLARSEFSPRLVHLGGGPGRELCEYFTRVPESRISCTYLDPDRNAIAYATRICACLAPGRVTYRTANPLGFSTAVAPDLIWAGGLLDYLDDRNIVSLLRRLWGLLSPGGKLAASNFSPHNPTRSYMEMNGWRVNPRDASHLADFACRASIPEAAIHVGQELEGVILFLHLSKG